METKLTVLALLMTACGATNAQPAPTAQPDQRPVLVNWLGQGVYYVAQVLEQERGMVSVRYADGSREWVQPERLRPLGSLDGRRVGVRFGDVGGHEWVGVVLEARERLAHVRFDGERGDTWVELTMLTQVDVPEPPSALAEDAEPLPTSVPIGTLRPGQLVLASFHGRVYGATVLAVVDGAVRIRWLVDGSEAEIRQGAVLDVLESPSPTPSMGDHVWYRSDHGLALGVVVERRGDLTRVQPPNDADHRGYWLDPSWVVAQCAPVELGRLRPGQLVGVLWHGSPWVGRVGTVEAGRVEILWLDGSREGVAPSAVFAAFGP